MDCEAAKVHMKIYKFYTYENVTVYCINIKNRYFMVIIGTEYPTSIIFTSINHPPKFL
jgi:hypothetical protein